MKKRSVWRAFRDWSMVKKLNVLYTLMILLPVVVVTLLGFQRYNENLKKKVADFDLQLLGQIGRNVDNYLEELDRISLSIYLEDNLETMSSRNKDLGSASEFQEKVSLDKAMKILMRSSLKDIMGAYLFKDSSIFSQYGSGPNVDYSNFTRDPWYDKVLAADGKGLLIPSHQIRNHTKPAPYVFSYGRSLIDVNKHESFGVLLIDVSIQGLADILQQVEHGQKGQLFITDKEGRMIYHPVTEQMTGNFTLRLPNQQDSFITNVNGEWIMVNYVTSSFSGWKIVGLVPIRELTQDSNILLNLLWTLAGITLLISIAISAVLTSSMMKPLKKIRVLMRKVEEGDYKVQYRSPANDEIGQVGHSFNVMVQKINELVYNELTMNILKKEADFKALQSQINPHFLYNTLESINMKAEVNGDYEVADMISLLGKLFRMSVNQSSEMISFAQELEFIRVYMKLQKMRYPKLETHIAIEEELLNAKTLPWIIQPLVENAFVHGLAPHKGLGCIRIEGWRDGPYIRVRVTDDGIGIDVEKLRHIQSKLLTETSVETSHIGLTNVHNRIRIYFGDAYGLTLRSTLGTGTSVELMLHDMENWSDEDYADTDDR
ncbi:sensor histidine kinase [Paenibacillus sp. HWE-109]|uniref:cache domain-containing sensor histidine kinase n=1 Tax=Paenibacillus sp. HWE-109 TaxID=1306526 RepID=UPI001EE0AF72|nr:sensor histidine kinase [Paenibacillus sp. HWE-109]UKS27948.1 sensor histidine kinase [Paenibacillus sp. HWE-109]